MCDYVERCGNFFWKLFYEMGYVVGVMITKFITINYQ